MTKIADCDSYVTSITTPQLIRASKLTGGEPLMNGIRPEMYTGGYCVVFPFIVNQNKYAVRCWHAHLDRAQERSRLVSDYLSASRLPYFVNFEYVEEGIATSQGIMPVVIMDWVDGYSFKEYIKLHLKDPVCLTRLSTDFLLMVKDLHHNNISHGDLQQGNIMIKRDGSLVLVDYDSMYVPQMSGFPSEIPGTLGYQHPLKFKIQQDASPSADYFSELIIYLSLKSLSYDSTLWFDLNIEDTDTLLFSKEDLESEGTSQIFHRLSQINSDEIQSLLNTLVKYLRTTNFGEFQPLEKIAPEASTMVDLDELAKQWEDNGYKPGPPPQIDTKATIAELISQWNNLKPTESTENIDEIRKMWN